MRALPKTQANVNGEDKVGPRNHGDSSHAARQGEKEPTWVTALRVCFHHYVTAHPQRFTVKVQQGKRRRIETVSVKNGARD